MRPPPPQTKFFFLGLSRTGTSSLAAGLTRAGVPAKHAPWAFWDNPAPTAMRRYGAFLDNPVPLLYRDLDAAHPGSRFVLVEREVGGWLASMQWMFETGSTIWDWVSHPYINECHSRLYGCSEFCEDSLRDAHTRHAREVREHFASRPGDLLIVSLEDVGLWPKVCDFLGLPDAGDELPHLNQRI